MPLWDERQPGEGHKAWAAFVVYRDLGPQRSIARAWRKATDRDEGESGRWELWARKFKWVERAAAYDQHLDSQQRAEFERQMAALARRRAELQIALQPRLEKRIEKQEAILDKFDSLPATDIVRQEDNQVTVKESGVIEVKTVKTKIRGINASGYARLSKETRETMKQAVIGFRQEPEAVSGSDDGMKELAKAIRDSP